MSPPLYTPPFILVECALEVTVPGILLIKNPLNVIIWSPISDLLKVSLVSTLVCQHMGKLRCDSAYKATVNIHHRTTSVILLRDTKFYPTFCTIKCMYHKQQQAANLPTCKILYTASIQYTNLRIMCGQGLETLPCRGCWLGWLCGTMLHERLT